MTSPYYLIGNSEIESSIRHRVRDDLEIACAVLTQTILNYHELYIAINTKLISLSLNLLISLDWSGMNIQGHMTNAAIPITREAHIHKEHRQRM